MGENCEKPYDEEFSEGEKPVSSQLVNGSTNGDGGVDPRHLVETTLIDMVELGSGCSGDCLACGAFSKEYDPAERRVCTITPERLERNLTQEIVDGRTHVRYKLVDLFRRYMTTGVDMEPLESDIFCDAAELIHSLSGGQSRLVAITHGLRCYESETESGKAKWQPRTPQLERLEKVARLMETDIVPLLVLSMDSAREKGLAGKEAKEIHERIKEMEMGDSDFMRLVRFQAQNQQFGEGLSNPVLQETADEWKARLANVKKALLSSVRRKVENEIELNDGEKIINRYLDLQNRLRVAVVEANAQSYAATVYALRPAIEKGKKVVFSLQGDASEESMVYVGITFEVYQRMCDILANEYGVAGVELHKLIERIDVEPPRYYTGSGRAKSLLDIGEDRDCTVIPYKPFVEGPFRIDPFRVNRGRIRSDGTLEIQLYRAKRTYNDTVDPTDNPWRTVDLRNQDFETVDVALPKGFLERLQFKANPRFVEIPDSPEGVKGFMDRVYPLSLIGEDAKVLVKRSIEDYATKYVDEGGALDSLDDALLRQYAVEALIPSDELDAFVDGDESLAERIIRIHTPILGGKHKKMAGEMGKILAIKALLEEVGVKARLIDDDFGKHR